MDGTRNHALLALGGIALAALLVVAGHVEVNDDLNPWALTVSDFAVSDRGGVVDVAMLTLAAVIAVLVAALGRAGRVDATARVLFAVAAGGMLLAAVVPTSVPGLPLDGPAQVHRYASVATFLALPAGGWLLARRRVLPGARRWLGGLAWASLVLAAAMASSAVLLDGLLIGLVERLLIVAEAGLLAVIAVKLLRRTGQAAPPRPAGGSTTAPAGGAGVTPVRGA